MINLLATGQGSWAGEAAGRARPIGVARSVTQLTLDTELYGGGNVVERSFNVNKQWRVLATRYDTHSINYRAGDVLSVSGLHSVASTGD